MQYMYTYSMHVQTAYNHENILYIYYLYILYIMYIMYILHACYRTANIQPHVTHVVLKYIYMHAFYKCNIPLKICIVCI